jgi:Icc-related predicted phosphoesterase
MSRSPLDTPTPRRGILSSELSEARLLALLEAMVAKVRDPGTLVAVIHPPRYACGNLDGAPKLDSELGVQMERTGEAQLAPVGSTAVREFVHGYQPPVRLHGRADEGRGTARRVRLLCANRGWEYADGVLRGAIVELGDGEVVPYQLVAG